MSTTRSNTERRYEQMLMSLSAEERLLMACDMFTTARKLVAAGMPPDQAANPRLARRYMFLAFYRSDFTEEQRTRILAYLDAHVR